MLPRKVCTLRARTHITDGGIPKGNRRVSGLVKKEKMRRRGAERECHMSARALTLGDSSHCWKTYAITRTRSNWSLIHSNMADAFPSFKMAVIYPVRISPFSISFLFVKKTPRVQYRPGYRVRVMA
ncbi:hypothetical protein NDU88_002905 [Pleurodeles waltl]|uniref:Uncharacterized protein n=1 Tax=Pleurodeles waltl TaxID=8319 RepID=A0AAV7WRI7_PLEWA|nr:hypothetical protein NDU88_002905 [Pleurodeles waltl]